MVKLPLHQFYMSYRDRRIANSLMKSQVGYLLLGTYCITLVDIRFCITTYCAVVYYSLFILVSSDIRGQFSADHESILRHSTRTTQSSASVGISRTGKNTYMPNNFTTHLTELHRKLIFCFTCVMYFFNIQGYFHKIVCFLG